MTKAELVDILVNEYEYTRDDVENMEADELIDTYLIYNGIIGFSTDIINVVFAAYEGKVFDEVQAKAMAGDIIYNHRNEFDDVDIIDFN